MLIVLLMMPLMEDAATDIARESGELILMILVILVATLVILMMNAACWGEQEEYHGRVVDLFHYVFHNTHCSIPPVGLHKSTDDGLTTTKPTPPSQSLFQVSTMAVLPRKARDMEPMLLDFERNNWHDTA